MLRSRYLLPLIILLISTTSGLPQYNSNNNALCSLSDVFCGSPTNGQALTWNSTYNRIQFTTITSSSSSGSSYNATYDLFSRMVSNSNNGSVPQLLGNSASFLKDSGSGFAQWAAIADAYISFSDITTGDLSTSKHGYAPKGTGVPNTYLNSSGAYQSLNYVCLTNKTGCNFTSVYISPTQFLNVSGSYVGGFSNISHPNGAYDGVTLNLTERASSPGLDIRMNFTSITSFNKGLVRYKTSTLVGDKPIIQLWSYTSSSWEDYAIVGETVSFSTIEQSIFYYTEHLSGGVVQARLYKSSNGNINNKYYIDWMAISDGIATPSGQEIDPYSIHITNINTTQFNYTNAMLQYIAPPVLYNDTNVARTNNSQNFTENQTFNNLKAVKVTLGDDAVYITATGDTLRYTRGNNGYSAVAVDFYDGDGVRLGGFNWDNNNGAYLYVPSGNSILQVVDVNNNYMPVMAKYKSSGGVDGITDTYDDGVDTTIYFADGITTSISTAYDPSLMQNITYQGPNATAELTPIAFYWNPTGLAQFANQTVKRTVQTGYNSSDVLKFAPECIVNETLKQFVGLNQTTTKTKVLTYNRDCVNNYLAKRNIDLRSQVETLKLNFTYVQTRLDKICTKNPAWCV